MYYCSILARFFGFPLYVYFLAEAADCWKDHSGKNGGILVRPVIPTTSICRYKKPSHPMVHVCLPASRCTFEIGWLCCFFFQISPSTWRPCSNVFPYRSISSDDRPQLYSCRILIFRRWFSASQHDCLLFWRIQWRRTRWSYRNFHCNNRPSCYLANCFSLYKDDFKLIGLLYYNFFSRQFLRFQARLPHAVNEVANSTIDISFGTGGI